MKTSNSHSLSSYLLTTYYVGRLVVGLRPKQEAEARAGEVKLVHLSE